MTSCKTRLLGAIGYPNRVARTPMIISSFCESAGEDYAYLLYEFPPDRLTDAVRGLKALGAAGFNVTMPYKQAILDFLDVLDPEAEELNAVNTVVIRDGKLHGYNTDYIGFKNSLRDYGIDPAGKRAVVIGAGAVSGPVRLALAQAGTGHVTWLGRTVEKAERCAAAMNARVPGIASAAALTREALNEEIARSELIFDITPVGMATNSVKEHDFDAGLLGPGKVVYHVVYSPWETPILRAARERGAFAVNGARMSLLQAKASFEIWTGCEVDKNVLESTLKRVEAAVRGGN